MDDTGADDFEQRDAARSPGAVFPVAHSLLAADALGDEVARRYPGLAPEHCTLYRAYANDVYFIETGPSRYALKVYRAGWRSADEIAYELDLLDHLAARGVSVATALPQRDGRRLGTVRAPEGPRHYALFAFASGTKPAPPFTTDLYRRFGRATALVHRAADDFASGHRRQALDLGHFLDRPLAALEPWVVERPSDRQFLLAVAEKVRRKIATLAPALDWGPCHGDLSLDNIHVAEDGEITFYDFDSGGPGWRASDPYGVYRYARRDKVDLWVPFLTGYREVRAFGAADLAAVPYFAAAYAIQNLGHQAANWVAWGGRWQLGPGYLNRELDELRRWESVELTE